MIHSFDVEVAKKLGMNKALILYNIDYRIQKNKANGKNFHDGEYWTYNSRKAFGILFPYMSEDIIKRSLISLQNEGYLEIGNYNKMKMDKTKRYSLTAKYYTIGAKPTNGVVENPPTDEVKIHQPIPDSKPDSKPDINISVKRKVVVQAELDRKFGSSLESVVPVWNSCYESHRFKRTIKITTDLKKARRKVTLNYTKEEFDKSVSSYLNEIDKRKKPINPDDDTYYLHRFTLEEFLTKKGGLQKFINNQ